MSDIDHGRTTYTAAIYGGPDDGKIVTSASPEFWWAVPSPPHLWIEDLRSPSAVGGFRVRYRYGAHPVNGSPAWLP